MGLNRKQPSRLLNLPAEIRSLIFEYAVSPDESTVVTFRPDQFQRDAFTPAIQPPLTQVNRQIRSESLAIYYECNDFVLHTESPKADDARKWLRCIAPHLEVLRRLSLWIRFVPLTNLRASSQGAINVSITRPKKNSSWQIDDRWRWVTVVRKPAELDGDVKYILQKLNDMTREVSKVNAGPEDYFAMMADLRTHYIQHKMS